jgi:hypothetical protein
VTSEQAGGYSPLTYPDTTGTGTYGTVCGTYRDTRDDHWEDAYGIYTITNADNVATSVFYQCWLTKMGFSNTVYASSNVEHTAYHFVRAVKPVLGSTNIFLDQDLGFTEDAWFLVDGGSRGTSTNESLWVGGVVSNQPELSGVLPKANSTVCAGFRITYEHCLLDWKFNYCTNR